MGSLCPARRWLLGGCSPRIARTRAIVDPIEAANEIMWRGSPETGAGYARLLGTVEGVRGGGSHPEAASGDDHLAADEVRFRQAEEVDGTGGVVWGADAAEWNELLHRLDLRRVET